MNAKFDFFGKKIFAKMFPDRIPNMAKTQADVSAASAEGGITVIPNITVDNGKITREVPNSSNTSITVDNGNITREVPNSSNTSEVDNGNITREVPNSSNTSEDHGGSK
jgi:hypothetical protein